MQPTIVLIASCGRVTQQHLDHLRCARRWSKKVVILRQFHKQSVEKQTVLNAARGLKIVNHVPSYVKTRFRGGGRPVFSVACHSLIEILFAKTINPDVYLVSSIFATKTHPDIKPIGPMMAFKIINSAPRNTRFILLGGMNFERYKRIKRLDFNRKVVGFAGIEFWNTTQKNLL